MKNIQFNLEPFGKTLDKSFVYAFVEMQKQGFNLKKLDWFQHEDEKNLRDIMDASKAA